MHWRPKYHRFEMDSEQLYTLKEVRSERFRRYEAMAEAYRKEREHTASGIKASRSYRLVDGIRRVMDDWYLDPILGLVFPSAGDTISTIASLPALHLAAVKIKSLRLVLAILFTIISDWLVGLIPVLGDVLDAFHKSNAIARRLCDGFVAGDKATIREVNVRAGAMVALAVAVVLVLVLFYDAVAALVRWLVGLF